MGPAQSSITNPAATVWMFVEGTSWVTAGPSLLASVLLQVNFITVYPSVSHKDILLINNFGFLCISAYNFFCNGGVADV